MLKQFEISHRIDDQFDEEKRKEKRIDYFSSNPERCTDFDAPSYVVVPQ